jgi:hypothetical protein
MKYKKLGGVRLLGIFSLKSAKRKNEPKGGNYENGIPVK